MNRHNLATVVFGIALLCGLFGYLLGHLDVVWFLRGACP